MIVNELDYDEYIAHYGVPGMKWGKHKLDVYNNTADKSGVTRKQARQTVKKANLQRTHDLQKFNALTPAQRDKEIVKARAGLMKANQDWQKAASGHKAKREAKGKHAARIALNKIGNEQAKVQAKASSLTTTEQHRKDMVDMGNAIIQGIYGPQTTRRIVG